MAGDHRVVLMDLFLEVVMQLHVNRGIVASGPDIVCISANTQAQTQKTYVLADIVRLRPSLQISLDTVIINEYPGYCLTKQKDLLKYTSSPQAQPT